MACPASYLILSNLFSTCNSFDKLNDDMDSFKDSSLGTQDLVKLVVLFRVFHNISDN